MDLSIGWVSNVRTSRNGIVSSNRQSWFVSHYGELRYVSDAEKTVQNIGAGDQAGRSDGSSESRSIMNLIAAILLAISLLISPPATDQINTCNDGLSVTYASDGSIYGDQNQDGVLSGADCEWT